ncbi:bifunctional glycosyltransferase family 2/GtrA family protein [Cryobacterium arcticum]|uniref:Dolichyl-phosphate beta-D-mannosyltransferase n=1 Tax=Cryobacterium arcticum TaxID=670052 RepID=A0A317ZXX9_9MICO|nr:bifunctional glycosyltransferase family 2/GtrA family protein [Cryobacterium arcticum]PXA70730.1 dolichyl-phosphate beta-D-mannosyltransferase [Cryobacterium arcticum]
MIILIPAYEPDARLVALVTELSQAAPETHVLVVDDGSGEAYSAVFDAVRTLGAEVIGHEVNLGKGYSLKVGFRHILTRYPGAAVVCADSDGQHRVRDILRVADRVALHAGRPDAPVVLGGRRFTGQVPMRSRVGNTLARQAFRFTTARSIRDTQTGLRGYPATLLEGLLGVYGDRFEYELNTLLEASAAGRPIDEIDIETVYLQDNASSHFRPVADSLRVMRPLLVYGAVSFGSFLVDLLALQIFVAATGSLGLGVVAARMVSASVNFMLNRSLVFTTAQPRRLRREAAAYAGLAVSLLAASYVGLTLFTQLGLPLLAAKLATDVILYLVSFQVQRRVVFARSRPQPSLSVPTVTRPVGCASGAGSPPARA